MDLMSSRQTGFGIGPIWWITVQEYCKANELDDEQTATMHNIIRTLDTEYMKRASKK